MRLRRQPDKPWPQMRSIVVEISAKECGHEQGHHRHRSAKARQLGLESQIRLIGAKTVHGQIGALNTQPPPDLRRDTLLPVQPLPEHHRLTGKQDRRLVGINRLIHTADPISCGIDGVVDDAPADSLVPYSCRHPGPPESRIRLTAGFVIGG